MELLVIVGIMGILILIALPTFRAYQPNLQLAGVARELTTDLRYAQGLAVTEQVEHGIRFYLGADKYEIIRFGVVEEILKSRDFPETVSFQQISGLTNNEAVFNPYGAAKEAGLVDLINSKNSTTTVDIRPSGFIKIIK